MDAADVRLIEELAANAWPASMVQHVGGWRLRFTPGVRARRSGSVLPIEAHGDLDLEERLAMVEDFYSTRGAPIRYQLSPAAVPSDLDEVLAARGYDVEAPVQVETAVLDDVLQRTSRPAPGPAAVLDRPDEAWMVTWTELSGRGDADTVRTSILDRIAPAPAYASVTVDDRTIAVGMGVLERGWLGVFSMATREEARRHGAATAVLHALAGWALDHSATRAYLQVEEGNTVATRLYARSGFSPAYGYHYRTRLIAGGR